MNLYDVAWQLSDLLETNRAVLLKTEPEVPDFTCAAPFKAIIWGQRDCVEIEVDPTNVMDVIAMFDATIFDKEKVERLYVWNLKPLCTYFHFYLPHKFITPANAIIDLKPIENFLGIKKNRPENLVEAINRTRIVLQNKGWQAIYKTVHLPLTLRILPCVETRPLLNEEARRTEHPYYEIEGIFSGRLNCLKKYAKTYLPHNMGPDVKRALKPRGYGVRFLCSDFRHCEVTVLQWLSGDEKLRELLDSGGDLHTKIYEIVTGDQCNTDNKRKLSKLMFLPVMYGCGPTRLGELLGVPESVAVQLMDRIKTIFSTAWGWIKKAQDQAKTGVVTDHFGRPRTFAEGEAYKARDFVVQGVAATVCQEKLIELHGALDPKKAEIVFSVHDGFGLVVKVDAARETYKLVKQVLESESKLCPGLKMKVEIKFGAKLDSMKVLWKD